MFSIFLYMVSTSGFTYTASRTCLGQLADSSRCVKSSRSSKLVFSHSGFQNLINVRYVHAKIAAKQAINHSLNAGLEKEVRKSDVVSLSGEATMVNSHANSHFIAIGQNAQMGQYHGKNFFVYNGQELQDLNYNQFELVTNEFGNEGLRFVILIVFVQFLLLVHVSYWLPLRLSFLHICMYLLGRFKLGTCKNSKIDAIYCSVEQLHKIFTCSIMDAIDTYKKIVSKWHVYECQLEISNHSFFLTKKQRVILEISIRYIRTPVSCNQLSALSKHLTEQIPTLKNKKISNKSERSIGISHIKKCPCPSQIGSDNNQTLQSQKL